MANFELGYINLSQGVMANNNVKVEAGLKAMEQAVKLRPNSAAALSDLAVAYHFKRQYAVSVETAFKAAKIEDTKEIVQNLVNCIVDAPPAMRESSRIKPIVEQAMTLASKYGIGGSSNMFAWIRPDETDGMRRKSRGGGGGGGDNEHDDSEEKGPPGIIGNGTGELVSADGYILTNKHVAKEGDYLMVRLSDGTMKVADRVVIDDEQDFAVIKIKTDAPLPFIRLAPYDHPPVGEDVDVFGFPLLGMVAGLNSSVKMTRGIVTAWDDDHPMCDVTVDANINPGNSGGPMVDHFGNLLAITTAKTTAGNIEGEASISSYGMGQSTGRLRKFLAHQAAKLKALKLEPGNQDKVLSNEELATRLTPITVCVFVCRGEVPANGAVPKPPAQP
jgi:S1-C subfamily serine protease